MKYLLPLSGILASAILVVAQTPPPAGAPKPAASAPAPRPVVAAPTSAPAAVSPEAVVITIGDEKITKAQFELIMAALPEQQRAGLGNPANRKALAESLSELKTLAQEGRARKIDQTPQAQSEMKLRAEQILAQLTYQQLANSAKPPDAAAVHAYYDIHKADFEQVHAKHILIRFQGSQVPVRTGKKDLTDAEALAKAQEIRAKIVAGAKFEDQAKLESDDTGNAPEGGDLGSFAKGMMAPPFEQAAFAGKPGEITEPVKTQFGYHLILVVSHETKTVDQARPDIEAKLKPQASQAAAQTALQELKAKKNITFNEAYFGK